MELAELSEIADNKELVFAHMTKALAFNVEMDISAANWNALCHQGEQENHAATALIACDHAVAKSDLYRRSRAIIRALNKDFAGAITDLKAFVAVYDKDAEEIQQQIETLEQGSNPFTE